MDVSVKGQRIEVSRSVPMSETLSSEQDRSQVVLRAMFNGDKTYDNRTEEIQRNQGTTYREGNHRVIGTSKLSGRGPGDTCNYGSCPHGGEGDGDVNRVHGHIQLVSESGMRTGMHTAAVEQSKKH